MILLLYQFLVKTFFNYRYELPREYDTEYIIVNIPNDNNV